MTTTYGSLLPLRSAAFSPVAELEDLYRSGFDDCERFLREECPGLVLVPYGSR